jgi:epoxyqueuosine reductase
MTDAPFPARMRRLALAAEWTQELKQWIEAEASAVGFDLASVAAIDCPSQPEERQDADRFREWVDAGRAGEMEYLKRRDHAGALLRSSTRISIPWARSVVICAMNYNARGPLSIEPAPNTSGWIARYAWNGRPVPGEDGIEEIQPTDYHDDLRVRLEVVQAALQARIACESRRYVDTGPIVERSLAARAGVGWIGKNTCVLNQKWGSWLLLGAIVTSIPMQIGFTLDPAADRCGSCTRCIDACPTDALVAPREMDASRCIAYLTIEKKGSIAEDLRSAMGRQIFGCDICQDVCPWNRRAPVAGQDQVRAREELINPELEWLAGMDAEEFRHHFRGSPLERTKRSRLHRNVAIAMGNSTQIHFLPQLESWSKGDDPVLAEAARWSIDQITAQQPSLTTTGCD